MLSINKGYFLYKFLSLKIIEFFFRIDKNFLHGEGSMAYAGKKHRLVQGKRAGYPKGRRPGEV